MNLKKKVEQELQNKETDIIGFAKTPNSRLVVPAESTMAILGTTRHLPDGYIVLVEPVDVSLLPGIVVNYTLSSVHHGNVLFEINNFSSEDIVIQRPSRIAKICACHSLLLTKATFHKLISVGINYHLTWTSEISNLLKMKNRNSYNSSIDIQISSVAMQMIWDIQKL